MKKVRKKKRKKKTKGLLELAALCFTGTSVTVPAGL